MNKDLMLSPERITEIQTSIIMDTKNDDLSVKDARMRCGEAIAKSQHLKTLNGVLDEIDEIWGSYARNHLKVSMHEDGSTYIDWKNFKKFSTYLRQQLQVELPKEEWLDRPDSEGWWWLIYPLGKEWSIPEVIYVGKADRKGSLIWETNYTKSIKRYQKAIVPELPKSKE